MAKKKMTAAQKRAALKYQKKLGQISIRLPKEELNHYKEAAQKADMPFRAWVLSALKKAAICAALVGIAAISIGMSRPAADTHQVETVYTVQPGDTWWDVAERYHGMDARGEYFLQYKHEQEQLNKGIDLGNLTPGQTLRIQYREGGSENGKN